MLYDCENPVIRIIGVEQLCWSAGNFKVAPRRHSALAFRIKGDATIAVGGSEYFVNTNDIIYLPQNMEYTASYTDTEMIVFHFVTERADSKAELYTLNNCEQIYKLFLQARTIWQSKEAGYAVYSMSLLYKILGSLCEIETKDKLPTHFLNAVSFINSHYRSSELNIKAACTESGISETVFRQLFKNHYQKTPTEYITDLRLEYARSLISGGAPIETAAIESGFNDPKYFARVVKKRLGCTPRELRYYGK